MLLQVLIREIYKQFIQRTFSYKKFFVFTARGFLLSLNKDVI